MNPWLRDPRVEKAEVSSFEAERVERQGDFGTARHRYREAAVAFASVAITVPVDHPNTRSDLAIAAVACFARAGDIGRAVEFARRVLAEPDALTEGGRAELERLTLQFARLMPPVPASQPRDSRRGQSVRDEVRSTFTRVV